MSRSRVWDLVQLAGQVDPPSLIPHHRAPTPFELARRLLQDVAACMSHGRAPGSSLQAVQLCGPVFGFVPEEHRNTSLGAIVLRRSTHHLPRTTPEPFSIHLESRFRSTSNTMWFHRPSLSEHFTVSSSQSSACDPPPMPPGVIPAEFPLSPLRCLHHLTYRALPLSPVRRTGGGDNSTAAPPSGRHRLHLEDEQRVAHGGFKDFEAAVRATDGFL